MVNQKDMETLFLKAFEDYSDAIFRHCYFRVYSKERAEELMQETFMKAWDYARKGGEIREIRPFLYKIANNLVIDESRKKKTFSLDLLKEQGFDPRGSGEHEVLATVASKELIEILDTLETKHKEVLVMRFINDLQPKEIARTLGVSENVISVRIHRALRHLKEITGDLSL